MSATEHAPTASEYIVHHLGHFSTHHQDKIVDFSIFNMDTIFWSIFSGIVGSLILWLAARKATSGVPGRFQAAVEILVEMVEEQSKVLSTVTVVSSLRLL
jgi:F-type H+-transporting ATPase subunit a